MQEIKKSFKEGDPVKMDKKLAAAKDMGASFKRGFENSVNLLSAITSGDLMRVLRQAGSNIMDNVKDTISFPIQAFKAVFNHPEWYENYDLHDIVNLNFGYRNSINNRALTMMDTDTARPTILGDKTSVGALMEIYLTVPKDDNFAFEQAMAVMYSKIRAANSGSVNYDVIDLAAYVLNIRSIRAALCQMRRTLACTYYTNAYDANQPKMLTEMSSDSKYRTSSQLQGFRMTDVANDAANLQNKLTLWFKQVRTLLPLNLNLFDRTDWLYSNVFADSDDTKANYYIFASRYFPIFTRSGGSTALSTTNHDLAPVSSNATNNYTTAISNINNMINTVITNPINAIIAGDILKAFGDSAFYNQSAYPIGTAQDIIYDEAALTQIQNATVLGIQNNNSPAVSFTWNTTHTVTLTRTANTIDLNDYNPKNRFINAYKDKITPGETISYTRLASIANTTATGTSMTITYCGTEICLNLWFYDTITSNMFEPIGQCDVQGTPGASELARFVNGWSIMDWAPMVLIVNFDSQGTTPCGFILWDFNNYAIATGTELSMFHQYAVMSLLAVMSNISRHREFTFADKNNNTSTSNDGSVEGKTRKKKKKKKKSSKTDKDSKN